MSEKVIDREEMLLAGWLSIISAISAIPILLLALTASYVKEYSGLTEINYVISIVYSFMAIYIINALRNVLNNYAHYSGADLPLKALVAMTYFIIVVMTLNMVFPVVRDVTAILEIIYVFVAGGLVVYSGMKILQCNNDLFGYRKLLGGFSIAEGICYATIVLIPVASVLSVVSSFFSAKIFFAVARAVQANES